MGALLILTTWILWGVATWGVGVTLVSKANRHSMFGLRAHAEFGIWVGLLTLFILVVLLNFFVPMNGTLAQWVAFTWLLVGLFLAIRWLSLHRRDVLTLLRRTLSKSNGIPLMVVSLVLLSAVIIAQFASAEPMDYDAGLYRMGLINYAGEYRAVPGLANLHGRFGFNSVLAPLAAFLENVVWANNGFRIVTGFVLMLFLAQVVLRVAVPRRRSAGDFLIVFGWAFLAWVILDDSGRWVPSPSQDIMALASGVAAFVFLADFVDPRSRHRWMASAALVSAGVSAAIRPLGWLLVISFLLSLTLIHFSKGPRFNTLVSEIRSLLTPLLVLMVLAAVMMARDVVLSGWLFYPFTFLPTPVEWLSVIPVGDSQGITWWGRAPGVSIEEAQSQGWFGPWVESFVFSREMRFFGFTAAASAVPLLWPAGRRAWREIFSSIILSTTPALVVTVAWFISAPDIRFGWTGLYAVAVIPLAFLLSACGYPAWAYRTGFFIIVLLGIATEWRAKHLELRGNELQPYSVNVMSGTIEISLGPPNEVETISGELGDGTPVVYPRDGENCYMVFPLCLLPGSGESVGRRGESIEEGFRQLRKPM